MGDGDKTSAYDLSTITFDLRDFYNCVRAVLTGVQVHVINSYKKYWEEFEFDHLCPTTLYKILKNFKVSKLRQVSGQYNYSVDALKSFVIVK